MTCQEYLALYSELLDERLDSVKQARCREHLQGCSTCANYDRLMRRGLRLVHEMPEITPSPDFHLRLQHRLFHMQDDFGQNDRFAAAGAAVALAVAGLIALAAWSPLLQMTDEGTSPALVADAPEETGPSAGEDQPLPEWWYAAGSGSGMFSYASLGSYSSLGNVPGMMPVFPGPYSPLIISPPSAGGALLVRYNE
jgi:hypothetical protein